MLPGTLRDLQGVSPVFLLSHGEASSGEGQRAPAALQSNQKCLVCPSVGRLSHRNESAGQSEVLRSTTHPKSLLKAPHTLTETPHSRGTICSQPQLPSLSSEHPLGSENSLFASLQQWAKYRGERKIFRALKMFRAKLLVL